MPGVDFHYDFSCPYAYLAHREVEAVCARTGAELRWRPFLLGAVFNALRGPGNEPMASMPASKARMNLLDMHRWADHLGVPLEMPSAHPCRTVLALRATLASGDVARASRALFRAYWALGRDVSLPETVREALDGAGFDGAAVVARADEPAIKEQLRELTDQAVRAGVFGAPAFVVDGELYWGQDRLGLVERALGGATPPRRDPMAAAAARDAATGDGARGERAQPELEFFFDVSSPFAYLAWTEIEALAARTDAKLLYRPFLLGGLFRAIGTPNVPLFSFPEAKQRHSMADLQRWAALRGAPLRFPSRFPVNTVKAMRMVIALGERDRGPFTAALFRACWVLDADLGDDGVLASCAREAGLDPAPLVDATGDAAVKNALRLATEEAERAGVCGAPSFRVRAAPGPSGAPAPSLLFWGQDRLELVERALAGWVPRREA